MEDGRSIEHVSGLDISSGNYTLLNEIVRIITFVTENEFSSCIGASFSCISETVICFGGEKFRRNLRGEKIGYYLPPRSQLVTRKLLLHMFKNPLFTWFTYSHSNKAIVEYGTEIPQIL